MQRTLPVVEKILSANDLIAAENRRLLDEHGLEIQFLDRINPVRPELMLFENLRMPSGLAKILKRILWSTPFRKKYHMTLIAVARKSRL